MEWNYVRLDEFCDSVRDGTHDTPKKTDSGYKLITAKHINNDGIDFSEAYLISEEDYNHINERSKVEKWDVLMSMIGNGLGKSFVVSKEPDYAIKNLALFKIGNENKAKWLHYFLSSSFGQGIINSKLQGTGQPFISLSFLRKMKIIIPSSEKKMTKIASILSTYDTLIENNTKRIRLLEQMAENLYKEWFVRFRFPGHENVEMEDGIPNGWNVVALGDIISENPKSKIKVSDANNSDGTYPFYTSGKAILKHHEYLVDGTNIFVNTGGVADIKMNIGKSHYSTDTWSIKGVQDYTLFLYSYLCSIKDEIQSSYFEGSALKHLKKQSLKKKKVLVPLLSVLKKYNKQIEAMFQLITKLLIEKENLIKQRDLLLPRLMSGKLEVKP